MGLVCNYNNLSITFIFCKILVSLSIIGVCLQLFAITCNYFNVLYLFQPVCLPLNIHGNINIYMEFILGI